MSQLGITTADRPVVKAALDKAGVAYEVLLADENVELVESFGITQAPTLVVTEGESVKIYAGVSQILQMIRQK